MRTYIRLYKKVYLLSRTEKRYLWLAEVNFRNCLSIIYMYTQRNPDPSSKLLLSHRTTHHRTVALNLYPYCVRVVHELLPLNFEWCVIYYKWFKDFTKKNVYKLHNIFYSDEAWFSLTGYVNGNKNSVWSTTSPHVRLEGPFHPLKISVWYGISGYRITGPIFFPKTITFAVYLEFIDQFIVLLPVHQCHYFLQHDGEKGIQHTPPWQYWRHSSMIGWFQWDYGLLRLQT